MKIETKYNIGDPVYVVVNDKKEKKCPVCGHKYLSINGQKPIRACVENIKGLVNINSHNEHVEFNYKLRGLAGIWAEKVIYSTFVEAQNVADKLNKKESLYEQ